MRTSPAPERLPASFRDPSGFLFTRDGLLLRQVNQAYREDYDHLMASGLYATLTERGLLVPHEEVGLEAALDDRAYRVLRPQRVPFVAYPYEWTFGQWCDAARLTLQVQRLALDHGMTLKDASAFNVQFQEGRPTLIDTLSFARYQEGEPWEAYRQFCQHFLAPLALMALRDIRLGRLMAVHLDGVPLDLAMRLLPRRSWLRPGLALHLHLHARSQRRFAGRPVEQARARRRMSRTAMLGLVDSLEGALRGLSWSPQETPWAEYGLGEHYSPQAREAKAGWVERTLARLQPAVVWDLGANVGHYSRLAAAHARLVLALDADPAAAERHYRRLRAEGPANVLPLVVDLTNPTPDLGWGLRERASLLRRGPADAVLALALIHHLAIGNNVPLPDLAAFFARLGAWLLLEFVPKEDPRVRQLLAARRDIFEDYHPQGFRAAFEPYFEFVEESPLPDTPRTLYLLRRREEVTP